MTEPTTLDLTRVGTVLVVARQAATHVTPVNGSAPTAITGVDEVLLEDGRTVYQCVRKETGCGEVFDAPLSARAHLTAHSAKRALKRVEVEEAARKAARVVNGQKGAAARKANAAKPTPAVNDETKALLAQYHKGADMVNDGFRLIEDSVHKLSMLPTTDPTIVEKARRYDQFKGLLT